MSPENKTSRLNLEWLVVSALRENLSLILETEPANYNDAIRLGQESFKELFGQKDSPFGIRSTKNNDYLRYEQEAKALTIQSNSLVTAEQLINKRINHISALLQVPENKKQSYNKLKRERSKLRALLRDFSPRFVRVDENQALRADFSCNRPGLEYKTNVAGKFNVYKTKTNQQFILRFLHPGQAEAATGVDMIYEIYDTQAKYVRIIAVQYKIWDKGTLYFSQHNNLEDQIMKACQAFCDQGYCMGPERSVKKYRFPYCTPFLRPTDKIFRTDNLISSGWHIPLCQVEEYTDYSYEYGKILRLEHFKTAALNTQEFEKLFQQEMIGSRWIKLDQVEEFYRQNKILLSDESIIIFSQKVI